MPYVPIMKADVSITKNLFIISIRQIISINDAIVMLNGAIVWKHNSSRYHIIEGGSSTVYL